MRTVSKKKTTSNESYTGEEFAGTDGIRDCLIIHQNCTIISNQIGPLYQNFIIDCVYQTIKQAHISNNKELLIPQMFKHYQTNNPGNTNKRSLQAENNEQE